jgi:hypothetical protein
MEAVRVVYVSGACNIGPAEIARRRRSGWVGLGVTAALWVVLAAIEAGAPWRLFLFLPAAASASGFLQASFRFCAGFGFRGVFNFTDELGRMTDVPDAGARRKDRDAALRIAAYASLIGAAVALAGVLTA